MTREVQGLIRLLRLAEKRRDLLAMTVVQSRVGASRTLPLEGGPQLEAVAGVRRSFCA